MLKLKAYAKKKPFIISGLLVLLIVVFLLISFGYKNNSASITELTSPQSGPMSNIDYQVEAQSAVKDYKLFLEGEVSINTIMNRKEHLLSLKISREYQDLHLNLVMVADYLQAASKGQAQEKDHARNVLSELYKKYSWLNT